MAASTIPPLAPEDHECADCGLSYLHTDATAAVKLLASLPARYREAVHGVADATLRHRPEPDTWSIVEYLCHIRDVFDVYTDRIGRTQTRENPVLRNTAEPVTTAPWL